MAKPDICKLLGVRIRAMRRAKGWRQIDLAAHADIGKNHISELEKGSREVGLRNLDALARALDVTPDVLLRNLRKDPFRW